MNHAEALAKWRAENDRGNGYDPQMGATVAEVVTAYEAEGARVTHRPQTSDEIVIVQFRGETLGIGNANGPWVQVLDQRGADWKALGAEAGDLERSIGIREHGKSWWGHSEAERLAEEAFKSELDEYGFDPNVIDEDDREEYTAAYIAALNGES
jgi:hypothetical protein